MPADPIMHIRNVNKSFTRGGEEITVLRNLNLDVAEGEFLGLMGPSGSGKTTLLNLIAGLDQPERGEVWIGGQCVSRMTEVAAGVVADAQRRLHLPVLPPAAGADGVRERRAAAPAVAAQFGETARAGADGARPRRPVGPHVPPARPALRRPAAARRHRPGHRHRPDADRRRRADRRPRRAVRRRRSSTCWANCKKVLNKTIFMVTHDPRAAERAQRVVHLEKGQLLESAEMEAKGVCRRAAPRE